MKTLKKSLAVLMAVLMLFSTMVIASAAESTTVAYFVNTDNWAEVVAHVWVDGGEAINEWPGEACTLVEGTSNVYSFDMTTGNRIIFNNNGAGAQTDNLNSEDAAGKYYEPKTNAFYATADEAQAAADAFVPVQPSGDANTVYFVNTVNWEGVYGHVWGGTSKPGTNWPGDALTADGNVYAYDIYDSTGLIFNNNNGSQTGDIEVTADIYGKYYELTSNAWYATAEEAVAAAVPQEPTQPTEPTDPPKTEWVALEPTPLDKLDETVFFFVIAGDEALCGSSWDPADRNNELTYNEETRLYEKTYENVADGTYNFKVTTGGAWDNADFNLVGDAKFGGANATITVPEAGATVKVVFDNIRAYAFINGEQVKVEVVVEEPAKQMTAKATAKKIAAGKTATVKVSDADGKVKFTTSDKKVATVNAKGVVTGLKKGNVTITATDEKGNKATVKITVSSSPKLSKKTASVKVKKSTTITVKGAATKVKVAKCKVATFKVKGSKITVTGKKAGKANVNVTVNGTVLKLAVKVTKK